MTALDKLFWFFDNDQEKVLKWLSAENHAFGGISPKQMIKIGKVNKVIDYIHENI